MSTCGSCTSGGFGLDEVSIEPRAITDQDAIDSIDILNLNTPKLKNLRGQAISGLIYQPLTDELISIQDARTQLAVFESYTPDQTAGYLSEFLSVKIHFLRQISGQ